MADAIAGLSGITFIIAAAEYLKTAKLIRQAELVRKFVHILSATFIATWPFFMSFGTIQVLGGLLILVVVVSKYSGIFGSVHGVERRTLGEILFPVTVFLAASFAGSPWIFAAAMLYLGWADGLAAAIGVQNLGHMNYKIFGQAKSLIGTLVFYIVAVGVTASVVWWLEPNGFGALGAAVVIWLPITATLTENMAVFGTDNFLVPLLVVAALNASQVV